MHGGSAFYPPKYVNERRRLKSRRRLKDRRIGWGEYSFREKNKEERIKGQGNRGYGIEGVRFGERAARCGLGGGGGRA